MKTSRDCFKILIAMLLDTLIGSITMALVTSILMKDTKEKWPSSNFSLIFSHIYTKPDNYLWSFFELIFLEILEKSSSNNCKFKMTFLTVNYIFKIKLE